MSISSQLPPFIQAARAAGLQNLALQVGQVLEAKVLGPAPGGTTQVEIGGQRINLQLPSLVTAGTVLKLEVQATGPQVRLAIQPAPGSAVKPDVAPVSPGAPAAGAVQQPAAPAPTIVTVNANAAQTAAREAQVSAPPSGQVAQQNAASNAPSPPPSPSPAAAAPQPPVAPPSVAQSPPPPPASAPVVPGEPQAVAQPTGPTAPPATTGVAAPVTASTQPASAATVPAPNGASSPVVAPSASIPAAVAAPVVAAPPLAVRPYPNAAAIPSPAPISATEGIAASTTNLAGRTPTPTPQTPAPSATPAPTTPQAALTQMVQQSLPRQDAVTNLTAALTSVAGKVVLPEPVARAAQQVLAGRVRLDGQGLDGAGLKQAVQNSGVFQEAKLGHGLPAQARADMKTALLGLRQTLVNWLGQQAPVAPAGRVPPPLKGLTPRARANEAQPLDTAQSREEVGRHLLERTESALARLRLHQNASLPDAQSRSADLSLDLPVLFGGQQSLLHIQIHRDDDGGGAEAGPRPWQMRFALSLSDLGEVGAQVSLRGTTAGVMLWATDASAAQALEEGIGELKQGMVDAGLTPGTIFVRHGEPPAPPQSSERHLLDARR